MKKWNYIYLGILSVLLSGSYLFWSHRSAESDALAVYVQMYHLQPTFIDIEQGTGVAFPVPKDQRPLKQLLEEDAEITFPEGTWVTNSGLPISGVMLRNTKQNHQKLVRYLDRTFPGKWSLYQNQ